jgi:transposase
MERLKVQSVLDIVYRLRSGQSERAIVRDTGYARNTVRVYHKQAKDHGFLDPGNGLPEPQAVLAALGPAPSLPQSTSTVEPYRAVVKALVDTGVEMAAIHQRLVKDHGYTGSYSSIRRFVSHLRPKDKGVIVRIETTPGQEAQVDFGSVGKMRDRKTGKERVAYCFVMTLSCSRHQYVEFVFDQKMSTWIGCHRRAFESFGGTPKELVIDNLKAAVIKADLLDPVLSEPYRKLAQYYGIVIHPCRPRTPRHKGKVESGVHYVNRNFVAGQSFLDIDEANRKVQSWVEEVAGLRDHGTLHEAPLARFLEIEQAALQPLPAEPFDLLEVKEVKVHPDCHVQVNRAYYSVPFEHVGRKLEAHVYERVVQLYQGVRLLVTHPRATRPGQRITQPEHYPKDKLIYLMRTPDFCVRKAQGIGPSCAEVVRVLLSERPLDQLRSVQGIIGLSDRYGSERVEAACRRALYFGDARYRRIKKILKAGLDALPILLESSEPEPRRYEFARTAQEFFEKEATAC